MSPASSSRNVIPRSRVQGIKLARTASPSAGKAQPRQEEDENLTHTAQADLSTSVLADEIVARMPTGVAGGTGSGGMSEEEAFRTVTRPAEIEGLENWGIPDEVDPGEASPELTVTILSKAQSVWAG